ncbi:BglG family transcription antiterminator [Streptococcus pluranimalium]|uniref:BglG family transcription antiterminator n=1 Tax=Streptococcus pluranimalium TaxID=82348 RepID=UPI0039FD2C86
MNQRQISILQDLVSVEGFLTAKTLAEKYSVSTKTVYSDVDTLKLALKGKVSDIEKIPRRGIKLLVTESQKKQLTDFILKQFNPESIQTTNISKEFLLLKSLFFEDGVVDIIDWSIKNYVSESSIRRGLEKLESSFDGFDISLVRNHGVAIVSGLESDIRKYLRNFFIKHLQLSVENLKQEVSFNSFFEKNDIEIVQRALSFYSDSYKFVIGDQYRLYLLLDLLVSKKRFQLGNVLKQEPMSDLTDNLQYYEVYSFATDLFRDISGIDSVDIPSSEVINIAYSLLSVGYERSDLMDSSKLIEAVQSFIARVGNLLGIDLGNDHYLERMLTSHIQPMVFRLMNKIVINNDITEEIKKKYSVLYNIVWLSSKQLADSFAIEMTDGEVALLTVHFEIAIEKLAKPLTIYLVSPQGIATTELIMNSLNRIISTFDRLIKIDSAKLTADKIATADLIISSIYIDASSPKFVFISPILTDSDFQLIQSRYSELLSGGRRMLSVIENKSVYTKSLVQKLLGNSVSLQLDLKDVDQCIDKLVELSSEANRLNPEYLKSILSREKMGSTSLYTGVALPHADPVVVGESQLVMLTLQRPIRWGSNMVKVVMLISITEEDELLYKDALISIYSKIDQMTFIDQLWESKTEPEFLKLIIDK